MRGTRSPGCRLSLEVDAAQVLPVPFAEIAAATMVPLSHILWSAVWIGIAEAALARATRYVRTKSRTGGSREGDARLVSASVTMSQLDGLCRTVIDRYDSAGAGSPDTLTTDFAIELNNLKIAASTRTVEVVVQALEICGMAGYQADGPFSMARLMTANSRLEETNAAWLLMRRYD
jgi:acyl-CoA dehydrogenase